MSLCLEISPKAGQIFNLNQLYCGNYHPINSISSKFSLNTGHLN